MMFGSKTGRNTPSANKYLFGLAQWVRHFLKPPPGRAVAYLDYRNQEYHIAGVLSGDTELLAVLAAPDPYMAFAITAGLAPAGATKQTHPEIRAVCKTLLLGTNYGMGAGIVRVQGEHPHRARRAHPQSAQAYVLGGITSGPTRWCGRPVPATGCTPSSGGASSWTRPVPSPSGTGRCRPTVPR